MSDLIRDMLRMTKGTSLSGRGTINVPDEMTNEFSGDEAQNMLMKDKLLTEMRSRTKVTHASTSVALIHEMEKDHVDEFLAHARKKIIKQGKPKRTSCCAKIGGVLDQVLGPEGADVGGHEVHPDDPGEHDPVGGEPGDTGHHAEASAFFSDKTDERTEKKKNPHHRAWREHIKGGIELGNRADREGGPLHKNRHKLGEIPPTKIRQSGATKAPSKMRVGQIIAKLKTMGVKQDDLEVAEFITETFALADHNQDCELRGVIYESLSSEEKAVQDFESILNDSKQRAGRSFGEAEGDGERYMADMAKKKRAERHAAGDMTGVRHFDFPSNEHARGFYAKVNKLINKRQHTGDRTGILGAQAGPIISGKSYVPVTHGSDGGGKHTETVTRLAKEHGGAERAEESFGIVGANSENHNFRVVSKNPMGGTNIHYDGPDEYSAHDTFDREKNKLSDPNNPGAAANTTQIALIHKKGDRLYRTKTHEPAQVDQNTGQPSGPAKDTDKIHPGQSMEDNMSLTASALAGFAEAFGHTTQVGNLSPKTYEKEASTRGDNKAYPTSLLPAKSPNKDAGALTKAKARGVDPGDPIGEDEIEEARAHKAWTGGSSPKLLRDVSPEEREYARKLYKDQHGEFKKFWGDDPNKDTKKTFVNRARADAHATHRTDATVHDGEVVSETANALAAFDEAFGHISKVGDLSTPSHYDDLTSMPTRPDNKAPVYKTGLSKFGKARGVEPGDPRGEAVGKGKKIQ